MNKPTYSYDEALVDSIKYFDGDEMAAKIFLDKYALRDNEQSLLEKTPLDMHRRLSKEFARVEKNKFKKPLTEEEIFGYLDGFKKIVPQGSPMSAIGNSYQITSLSNCFVLESPVDSYAGILKTDEQLVQISKRRGGIGLDISHLRPVGSPTQNAARTSTGIAAFMERFSNSIREVGQSGRRGALMLSISVHHPEVLTFATIKADLKRVTGANISIRLSDEFLRAVEKDAEYELRWPVDSDKPKISTKISARKVWKEIVSQARNNAEPGLLFWDNIIRESPADCYSGLGFKTQSTNPCQPAWAKLLTPNGIRELKDLNVGDIIWSSDGWTKIEKKWSTGVKDVYAYHTTFGTFYSTENHRILSEGGKVEVSKAESIDILRGPLQKDDIIIDPQDVIDGVMIGDGTVHKASGDLVLLCLGENDSDYFSSEISSYILKHRPGISHYTYEVKTTILAEELPHTYLRKVPERFLKGSFSTVCGFLRGLFSANGGISGERVTLKATSRKIVSDVQLMLSSIGIASYFTTNKSKVIKFKNGKYRCKKSYDINITRDRYRFDELIGFIQLYKQESLNVLIEKLENPDKKERLYKDITLVEHVSIEEVFDITVSNHSHTYWSHGFNVSNCGEIPLCSFDSCRLLCMNLFSYVKNPFQKDSYYDFEEFYKDAQVAQRLMDDMIDLELESIDKIIKKIEKDPEDIKIKNRELELWQQIKVKCENGRRTGTGITALGDAMAAIGIKYGSDESVEFAGKIYKTLKFGAYRSSVDMSRELGHFKIWNHELEKDCPFLKRIKSETLKLSKELVISGEELWDDMKKYGRRNIALLTTAPTGTVSTMTRTSSGIEPVFQLVYTRRKKINPNDKNTTVDFTDEMGDKWQEFTVYHSKVEAWKSITGESDVEKSPWFGACAEDLKWNKRVELQAEAQRHIDHAISSTLNLPESVSLEKVAEIYETAWKAGCKGITVYRKNCRSGVLVDKKEEKISKIQHTDAPKRPKNLPCHVHHIKITKKLDKIRTFDYLVVVGLLNEEPYEVFAMENGHLDKKYDKGIIVKNARGHYTVQFDDGTSIENLTKNTSEFEDAITRMLSTALRHGVDIGYVVHQLEKAEGEIYSFSKAISRALKKHIKDGTKVTGETCSSCGGANLQRAEGCLSCKDCGSSKCG